MHKLSMQPISVLVHVNHHSMSAFQIAEEMLPFRPSKMAHKLRVQDTLTAAAGLQVKKGVESQTKNCSALLNSYKF